MLYIDDREPQELKEELVKRSQGDASIQRLSTSDISFGDEVGFERKEFRDLLSSIRDGRLWNQLNVLKNTYPKAYIIFEGNATSTIKGTTRDGRLSFSPISDAELKTIYGIEDAILLGWNIPVIKTRDIADTANRINRLYTRYSKDKPSSPPRPVVKRSKKPEEIRLNMLQTISGLGPKTAKNILEIFTIEDLVRIDDPSILIRDVKGLRRNIADLIIEVF